MAPVGILLAGLVIPKLSHSFGPKPVAITMAFDGADLSRLSNLPDALGLVSPSPDAGGMWWRPLHSAGGSSPMPEARGAAASSVSMAPVSVTFGIGPAVVGWSGDRRLSAFRDRCVRADFHLPIPMVSRDVGGEGNEHLHVALRPKGRPCCWRRSASMRCSTAACWGSVYGVREGLSIESAVDDPPLWP